MSARLTREIGMKHFISPRMAPVFCAFGMMYADLKHNYTRPYSAQAERRRPRPHQRAVRGDGGGRAPHAGA